ncbi:GAF domain-containing protein [Caenimonas sedimenti]|uniref:histidine kinase n=1 Tax=Caenimonas sedimenti TaxID=2596921 RepID=A0A562ZP41_9BURK|nr:GAF domain-containing protein [Caenimonas sedimenti]TWO70088.1 GAF domain-containing protein [Caenimonas sedimenti]
MTPTNDAPYFLQDGGELGALMRAHDWSTTQVGAPHTWPASLRTLVAALLQCQLPMYIAWGDGLTQFYNDAYRPILGNKHPAALGRPTPETWDEIWPTIGPMWAGVLDGKPVGFDDFKLTIERFGYPEDCYFNFSYSPVKDDSGRPSGVMVTFAETTARVLNERRLRFLDDLSQSLRDLEDPQAAMRVTAEMLGRHLAASRCAYASVREDEDRFDLLGDFVDGVASIVGQYRFADFGSRVLELMRAGEPYVNFDVDTDPLTAGTDLSAFRSTQIRSVVCVPLHKRGRLVAAMAVHQSTPRRWTPAEIELVQTVVARCWESLERIRAASANREEARLLEILNRTGDTLTRELDIQTVLQRVTDAATELTGAKFGAFFYNGVAEDGEAYVLYTLSGAPREAFEQFGHPRPTPMFAPTFRGEPPVRIDDVLLDPRYGQWAPHHGMPRNHLPVRSYLAVPVISRSGEPIGGLFFGHPEPGVFNSRSERLTVGIASQAAIAIDNARLYEQSQKLAEERRQLLESERSARMEAERANSMKEEFLATLSHELRTPLSAITGWVHILRAKLGASQPELLKGVEVIDRSTKAQVQLIEDLLDISRIRAGKLVIDRQPVSPVAFVQAAIDMIRPALAAKEVELSQDFESAGLVAGDASRLQQVVWNLLSNASKFTPPGGRVHVRVRQEGDWAVISVEDSGAGIRAEVLETIFERFRQGDSSTTRRFGGLGLGLSIVRHLVSQHGGSVRAHSAGEGRGSRFEVRLPILESMSSPVAGEPTPKTDDTNLAGLKVLVVEDEADSRELLAQVLQDHGATVQTADGARRALAILAQFQPAVLLSDIGMPEVDGYQLIRSIRGDKQNPLRAIPAIAMTAFVRPEDRQRAHDAGYDLHLAKPLNPAEVVAAIAALQLSRNGQLPTGEA